MLLLFTHYPAGKLPDIQTTIQSLSRPTHYTMTKCLPFRRSSVLYIGFDVLLVFAVFYVLYFF